MIRRFIYASRPRPDLAAQEIPRIVAVSRANNERDGIGGVLLYTGEDFVQLIEGAPDRVEATWRRIRADPRHVEVVALLDERDVQAWFADWRVGYLADAAFSRTLAEWRERGRWDGPGSRQAMRLRFAGADSL